MIESNLDFSYIHPIDFLIFFHNYQYFIIDTSVNIFSNCDLHYGFPSPNKNNYIILDLIQLVHLVICPFKPSKGAFSVIHTLVHKMGNQGEYAREKVIKKSDCICNHPTAIIVQELEICVVWCLDFDTFPIPVSCVQQRISSFAEQVSLFQVQVSVSIYHQ